LWWSNCVSGYGRDQECERCDHRQGDPPRLQRNQVFD
jgi:hypothetical protein